MASFHWRRRISCLLSVCMLLSSFAFSGCSDGSASSQAQASSSDAPDLSDEYYIDAAMMDEVLEQIYSGVPELLRESVTEPTDEEIEEVLKLNLSDIDDAFIRYSSGSFGVADIYVIKPTTDALYSMKEELDDLRLRRIDEFEQYDVYDALSIAEDSEVVQMGTYLVLVMMENAEEALELLEPIIPQGR